VALAGLGEGTVENRHLPLTSDEPGESLGCRHFEGGTKRPASGQLKDIHRLGNTLGLHGAQAAQLEVATGQGGGGFGDIDGAGSRQRFHTLGEPHRIADRGVIDGLVLANGTGEHLTRVEAEPHREVDAMFSLQVGGVADELVTQTERRRAGPSSVVLVGDGCTEKGMMPSPVNLSMRPPKRSIPARMMPTNRSMRPAQSSGSIRAASVIEPTTSAKRTVTCFRSPSRAAARDSTAVAVGRAGVRGAPQSCRNAGRPG
jgi:hypothetical protein